jgi:hypothetical protein
MCVAASSGGGLLVRVDPDHSDEAAGKPHARLMEMRGREMPGWIRVDPEGVAGKRELRAWVARGVRYAGSLPAKG